MGKYRNSNSRAALACNGLKKQVNLNTAPDCNKKFCSFIFNTLITVVGGHSAGVERMSCYHICYHGMI